jgi:transcriptional antiterminator NusG
MTEHIVNPDLPPVAPPPPAQTEVHQEELAPSAAETESVVHEQPAPPAAETEPEASGIPDAAAEVSGSMEVPDSEPSAEAVPQPEAAEAAAPPAPASKKHWYVVKVQSGREESIKESIERRVKIEGLEEFYGQIVIPVERVTEMRNGKRVQKERKLYPGYLMVEVEYNDHILYLFRETSGVGDFVGGSVTRAPQPMSDREIERMLHGQQKGGEAKTEEGKVVYTKPRFGPGDRVKVTDGTFAGMEGEVKELHDQKGSVSVELTIFGRPVQVEFEYWQVEQA